MPIYEFQCQKCGYKFEQLVLGHEKPRCPKCQSLRLKKFFSAPSRVGKENSKISSDCNGNTCPICHLK